MLPTLPGSLPTRRGSFPNSLDYSQDCAGGKLERVGDLLERPGISQDCIDRCLERVDVSQDCVGDFLERVERSQECVVRFLESPGRSQGCEVSEPDGRYRSQACVDGSLERVGSELNSDVYRHLRRIRADLTTNEHEFTRMEGHAPSWPLAASQHETGFDRGLCGSPQIAPQRHRGRRARGGIVAANRIRGGGKGGVLIFSLQVRTGRLRDRRVSPTMIRQAKAIWCDASQGGRKEQAPL